MVPASYQTIGTGYCTQQPHLPYLDMLYLEIIEIASPAYRRHCLSLRTGSHAAIPVVPLQEGGEFRTGVAACVKEEVFIL